MKKLFNVFVMPFFIAAFGVTTSCGKDDSSVGIEYNLLNRDNGFTRLDYLLKVDAVASWAEISIMENNNFHVQGGYYSHATDVQIVCVGKVKSLNRIESIPQSGWSQDIAVSPGKGYIIRHKNIPEIDSRYCRYARIYVIDWIESTSGGIIGATILYEDNWKIDY